MEKFLRHPFVVKMKKGLLDIKTALQEGNVKLFVKQLAVVGVCFWLLHWTAGKFDQQISRNQEQISSIDAQQRNEQEYVSNKNMLLTLEPLFPDIEAKNNWLTSKLLNLYKEVNLPPQLEGSPSENNSNSIFLLMSQGVSTKADLMKVGKFLERIENEPSYLRVSEVTITKDTSDLGNNKVTMRFNTVFPKQKIGATLFKNYKELIAKQEESQVPLDSIPSAPIVMNENGGGEAPAADEEVSLE